MINKKIVMILEDDIDLAEGIELSLKDGRMYKCIFILLRL